MMHNNFLNYIILSVYLKTCMRLNNEKDTCPFYEVNKETFSWTTKKYFTQWLRFHDCAW